MKSTTRRLAAASTVAVVALLVAGACAKPAPITPGGPGPTAARAAFDARAARVAAAWAGPGVAEAWRGTFIPLGDLTQLDGDPHFTGPQKVAFGNGWITYHGGPVPAPGPGRVRFADGSSMDVPLQSEADAFAQINTHQGPCDGDCVPLVATRADLGVMALRTSRGAAKVPAWIFTIDGLDAKIVRVAVAPSAIGRPPTIDVGDAPTEGFIGASSLESASGATVVFDIFYGSCDSGFTPLVYEDAKTVVLGSTITHTTGACDLVGHLMSLKATLHAPVGDRLILDTEGNALVKP